MKLKWLLALTTDISDTSWSLCAWVIFPTLRKGRYWKKYGGTAGYFEISIPFYMQQQKCRIYCKWEIFPSSDNIVLNTVKKNASILLHLPYFGRKPHQVVLAHKTHSHFWAAICKFDSSANRWVMTKMKRITLNVSYIQCCAKIIKTLKIFFKLFWN